MPKTLHIKIVGNRQQSLCQANCSNDWSQPDVQARVKTYLLQRFGDRITLDYLDVKDSDKQFKKETRFPLLIVDGYIRLSGQFDMRQLLEIVEAQLELEIADR